LYFISNLHFSEELMSVAITGGRVST